MRSLFLKILFSAVLFFAANEGFGSSDLNTLYNNELKPTLNLLKPQQEFEKKRQTTIYISIALAIVIFIVFAKYFKLAGVLVWLVMVAGGYYVLTKNIPKSSYESLFLKKIVSPIGVNCCGYTYLGKKLNLQDIKNSSLFSPEIDNSYIGSSFGKSGVIVAYVVLTFKTKESASVERFNKNRFEGFIIKIDHPNTKNGAIISQGLIDEVANMDLAMSSFFAKGKRGKKIGEWQIYGELDEDMIDKITPLKRRSVGVSFTKDAIYIALPYKKDPFKVDSFKRFDLESAKELDTLFRDIDNIVSIFK
ncbi:MAG: hypothetical protein DSZ06_04185 [Sulfurospirillum sp.]|nr:MAG: hypothetical protein DSZ06_04185 [Sulfurospirillum sp.]